MVKVSFKVLQQNTKLGIRDKQVMSRPSVNKFLGEIS